MGTQTMTDTHAGRSFNGWNDAEGTPTDISVVVKRSRHIGVFMSAGGHGTSIKMSKDDAVTFAMAIMAAVNGTGHEDEFMFEATRKRVAEMRAQSDEDECDC